MGGTKVNKRRTWRHLWLTLLFQFFVGADGENGLTMEHSPSDGVAVVAMSDHILKKVYEEKGEEQDHGEVQVAIFPNLYNVINSYTNFEIEISFPHL